MISTKTNIPSLNEQAACMKGKLIFLSEHSQASLYSVLLCARFFCVIKAWLPVVCTTAASGKGCYYPSFT